MTDTNVTDRTNEVEERRIDGKGVRRKHPLVETGKRYIDDAIYYSIPFGVTAGVFGACLATYRGHSEVRYAMSTGLRYFGVAFTCILSERVVAGVAGESNVWTHAAGGALGGGALFAHYAGSVRSLPKGMVAFGLGTAGYYFGMKQWAVKKEEWRYDRLLFWYEAVGSEKGGVAI